MTALLVAQITARCDVEPGWIHVNAPFVMKSRLAPLNPRWDAGQRLFKVPLTWANCLILRTALGEDLALHPSLAAWGRTYRTQAKMLQGLRDKHDRMTASPNLPGFDTMFPHQRSGVDLIFQSKRLHQLIDDGMGARYLIMDSTGAGKGVPLDSRVLTPAGWTSASTIRPGDLLIGSDGQPVKVEDVYPQSVQDVYRVTFSDGVSVVTDGPHLWTVTQRYDRQPWHVMSTQDLHANLYTNSGRARWRIPMLSAPVEYSPQAALPMDPYALGVVLGDGYIRPGKAYAELDTDKEILESISARGIAQRPGCWHGVVSVPLDLTIHGCKSWEKFIPSQYLTACSADRLALLQGLLDTDGSPCRSGGVEFSTTAEHLLVGVVDLVQSLGGIARASGPRITQYTHSDGSRRTGRPSWRVNIKLPQGMLPFRLRRKLDDWTHPTKYPVTRIIKDISPAGRAQTVCFRVSAPDSLFVIDGYVVTHNTRVALGAIAQLGAAPVVILCPKSVIRVWHDEAQVFFPGADIREVHGTAVQRRKMLAPGGFLYIMSYESLRAHSRILGYPTAPALTMEQKAPKEVQALGAQMLVVDEVHRCASPMTLQTRAAWAVADDVEHVIAMTGTPIQESPEDLWAVLRMLDRRTFPGITAFRDRYLDVVINPFGGWDVRGLNPATRHEFMDLFHTMSRRAEKAEVLAYLPDKVYETRWVELPADNRKDYRQMEKQYLLEVESGEVTAASNPMVAAGRLIQLANSTLDVLPPPAEGEPEIVRMVDPSPKVKAFMADVDAGDFDGMSVVVYSASKQLLNLCAKAFDEARPAIPYTIITGDVDVTDRNEAISRFQAGEVRFILISTAGDTGITLTKASVMVRLTRSWSYVKHAQAEDRVHRPGSEQHDSILYVDYVTEGTIEEGQVARLNEKREKATEVLHPDELRQMIQGGSK